jgi:hypothetical protein
MDSYESCLRPYIHMCIMKGNLCVLQFLFGLHADPVAQTSISRRTDWSKCITQNPHKNQLTKYRSCDETAGWLQGISNTVQNALGNFGVTIAAGMTGTDNLICFALF